MRSVQIAGAAGAPPPIVIQVERVLRRISASDSVAALIASLAYGEPRRGDVAELTAVTASRCTAASAGCR